jgi:hypothetical protein
MAFSPESRKHKRSTQLRIKGFFSSSESMISEKGLRSLVAPRAPLGPIWMNYFNKEGAYLAAAVDNTPKSPRIESGGRAIAAADIGRTASYTDGSLFMNFSCKKTIQFEFLIVIGL